jgi:hypothetical protein
MDKVQKHNSFNTDSKVEHCTVVLSFICKDLLLVTENGFMTVVLLSL